MKNIHSNSILILFFIVLLTSCSTISYIPKISLDVSPKTINKSVTVEKFKNSSPEKDKKNPFGGFSVTNASALASDLELEVTNAVVADFSANALFKQVSRRIENSDYIMKGEITKFLGKSRLTTFGTISFCTIYGTLLWYFGLPIRANETAIEIAISLYNPNGNLIGTYKGMYKEKVLASIYNNNSLAVPTQTNKSFSKAIGQIREQILNDIAKYQ